MANHRGSKSSVHANEGKRKIAVKQAAKKTSKQNRSSKYKNEEIRAVLDTQLQSVYSIGQGVDLRLTRLTEEPMNDLTAILKDM